jgi:hypothetical protein
VTAASSSAAANRLADAVKDQVKAFTILHPEIVPALVGLQRDAAEARLDTAEDLRQFSVPGDVADQGAGIPVEDVINIQFTAQDAASLALWSKWRYVYDIDPDLLAELGDSADGYDIPAGLFARLPHPNPYVAFPEPIRLPLNSRRPGDPADAYQLVEGFMVTGRVDHLVGPMQRSTDDALTVQLGLLFGATVWKANGTQMMLPGGYPEMILSRVTIPLSGNVNEILTEVMSHFIGNANLSGIDEMVPVMVRQAISALIYLCTVDKDVREIGRPICNRIAKAAGRKRLDRIIEVGYQVGAALRAYRRRASTSAPGSTGGTVKPHVRRAHPHTYWTGPGKPGQRTEYYVKWLPPIPIHPTGKDATITTVIGVR